MTMRFFNTYSRRIEEFEARDSAGHAVSIYTCGPTVYSRAHIGNFRAYIFEDLLQRHLELRGYQVQDRKSTRLNSSHVSISYAVFCLKKKKKKKNNSTFIQQYTYTL